MLLQVDDQIQAQHKPTKLGICTHLTNLESGWCVIQSPQVEKKVSPFQS